MSSIPVSGSVAPTRLGAVSTDVVSTETSTRAEPELETDPIALWERYVHWLYEDKELGLSLDVSRIGFTDEFYDSMQPRFEHAFKAMAELEGGSIANPDEGRMVGHYWLRKPELAPTPFLQNLVARTFEDVISFAKGVVNGKVPSILQDSYNLALIHEL
jgi:glucose-6-phosphate isomerase